MSQHRFTLPLLGMFAVSAGFNLFVLARSADSACSQECWKKCRSDNNWCYDTGTMAGVIGRKYYTDNTYGTAQNVANDDYCIEKGTEEAGTPGIFKTVHFRELEHCTPDCGQYDSWTTGSPFGTQINVGFEQHGTVCNI